MKVYLGQKLFGFTLAEVLITLLIIGVISAIVIPVIINETQNAELRMAFKKHYAEVSIAYNSLVQDNGGTLKGSYNDLYAFANAFANKFNYVKFCVEGTANVCVPNITEYKNFDKTTGSHASGCDTVLISYPGDIAGYTSIVLADGAVITFTDWVKDCNISDAYISNACTDSNHAMNIDVNGPKPPNVLGRDLFIILPYEKIVKPAGMSTNVYPYTLGYTTCMSSSSCSSTSSGFGCAAKVLSD